MTFEAKVRGLLGREPSADELARLQRLQTTLQITDNDALFSILLAFEHYHALFETVPKQIKSNMTATKELAGKELRNTIDTYGEQAKADLAAAVLRVVNDSRAGLNAKRVQWMGIGAGVAAGLVVGAVAIAFFIGKDAGRAQALGEAHEAVVWAETPDGKAAKALSDLGELGALLRCDRPGWKLQKLSRGEVVKGGPTTRCVPQAADNKTLYGWLLFEQQ